MDIYRVITVTVTSVFGKLFEELLLLRSLERVDMNQSDCQFGFTRNLNPLSSSFVCSEAIVESKISTSVFSDSWRAKGIRRGKPRYFEKEHLRRRSENRFVEDCGLVILKYVFKRKVAGWSNWEFSDKTRCKTGRDIVNTFLQTLCWSPSTWSEGAGLGSIYWYNIYRCTRRGWWFPLYVQLVRWTPSDLHVLRRA